MLYSMTKVVISRMSTEKAEVADVGTHSTTPGDPALASLNPNPAASRHPCSALAARLLAQGRKCMAHADAVELLHILARAGPAGSPGLEASQQIFQLVRRETGFHSNSIELQP